MLLYLAATGNQVGKACRLARVSTKTYYQWRCYDPEFLEASNNIIEEVVDVGEHELMKKVRSGDTQSIIYLLKTQGRHRGWGVTPSAQNIININEQRIQNNIQNNIKNNDEESPAQVANAPVQKTVSDEKEIDEIVRERTGASGKAGMIALDILAKYCPGEVERVVNNIKNEVERKSQSAVIDAESGEVLN